MNMKFVAAAVTGAALVATVPAYAAVTVTASPFASTDPGPRSYETTVLNFVVGGTPATGTTGAMGATLTGNYGVYGSSVTGAAAPAGGSGAFLAIPLATSTTNPGIATITFSGTEYSTATSMSFLWGSIDSYNFVRVFDAAGTQVTFSVGGTTKTELSGADFAPATGNQSQSRRVYFDGLTGISRIELQSGTGSGTFKAFELDTLAIGAVPEPSTWAMMVLGFGAVGFAARRRSKVAGRIVAA